MDKPLRNKLNQFVPEWLTDGSWFLVTIKCVPQGTNQLCRIGVGDVVLSSLAYNHDKLIWHCRLGLLMPDHLHGIIAFPPGGMETTIKSWKKFVASKLSVAWEHGFFGHRLRHHRELQEKTSYVQMNPVRKGLCERAEDWVWVYRPADRPPTLLG